MVGVDGSVPGTPDGAHWLGLVEVWHLPDDRNTTVTAHREKAVTVTTNPPAGLGRVGLGASAFGNLYRAVRDDDVKQMIEIAWEGEIRYSTPHRTTGWGYLSAGSDTRSAATLNDQYRISTRVGRVLELEVRTPGDLDDEGFIVEVTHTRRWDFSSGGGRRSVSESLDRIGFGRVDIVYLNDPEDHLDRAEAEALPELAAMRDVGIVRQIGVGSKSTEALTRPIRTGLVDLAMIAGRYTLLEQPALTTVLPAADETEPAWSWPASSIRASWRRRHPVRPLTTSKVPFRNRYSNAGKRSQTCARDIRSTFPTPPCSFRSAIRPS